MLKRQEFKAEITEIIEELYDIIYQMCGGLAFPIKRIPKNELEKWFKPLELKEFEKSGTAQTFFWSQKPVLPIVDGEKVKLVAWGNRDKNVKLPQTGWAKQESVDGGKWFYLHPQEVVIPVERGCERKHWFDVSSGGFRGLLVEKDGEAHAYMITKAADPNYLKLTGHDRQPVEV